EFVEDWKQNHWSKLGQEHKQAHKQRPSDEPPMLRELADHEIQQLHHNPGHHQTHEKSFRFVPEPGARLLRGKLESPFEAKSVVIKAQAQHFADQEQKEQVDINGERIVLESAAIG